MDPESMRDQLPLDEWEAPSPPKGFGERTMALIEASERAERAAQRRRRLWRAAAVAAPIAVAAAGLLVWMRPPSSGDVTADARRTFSMGSRAIAVAEPGSHVSWRGDEVSQDRGDVFYRVEPGKKFRVHTPGGDVEVLGTCFRVKVGEESMNIRDVKSGAAGAAMTAIAFVGVYEGRVLLSRGDARAELGAGEAAAADERGVHREGDVDGAGRAFDARLVDDDASTQANGDLQATIKDYRQKLASLEAERSGLEKQLEAANSKLDAVEDPPPPKDNKSYDLSRDDWKELAKDGTVKFRMPCSPNEKGWTPSDPQREALGLGPDDIEPLREAYAQSYKRVWGDIRPVCVEVFGPEVADRLGPTNCPNAIVTAVAGNDWPRLSKAMRDVAEIRAGIQPMPDPMPDDPIMRVFLRWTSEMGELEKDLAGRMGPERAHEILYSSSVCAWNSDWPGAGRK